SHPSDPRQMLSKQSLRKRLRSHYRGNAEGSTLRLTLGCLLAEELSLELRRVGSGKRLTFCASGEAALSQWMDANALVTWIEHPAPWEIDVAAIKSLLLPLNLHSNGHHPFCRSLSGLRAQQRTLAREKPIFPH